MKIKSACFIYFCLISQLTYAQGCDLKLGFAEVSKHAGNLPLVNNILNECDAIAPNNQRVLFLHGLYSRKLDQASGNYRQSIQWLQRANIPDSPEIAYELAITYEWSNQLNQAQTIYAQLSNIPSSRRNALLGLARIALAERNFPKALGIYTQLLLKNPNDVEALNGIGRIQITNNKLDSAIAIFSKVLKLDPINQTATQSLEQIKKIRVQQGLDISNTTNPGPFCKANMGLRLLNEKNPPLDFIKKILDICDKQLPNNEQVLLLHGLLARREAVATHNFSSTITWLKQAAAQASYGNDAPLLELAIAYEWAQKNVEAEHIYNALLLKDPKSRAALLGKARVAVLKNDNETANKIYQDFLSQNPQDTDALNGLARMALSHKQFETAKQFFTNVLGIDSLNQDALIGIAQIQQAIVASKPKPIVKTIIQPPLCEANRGLILLNTPPPNYQAILQILRKCDANTPNDTQALLLHGLLARQMGSNYYPEAINWLSRAARTADAKNLGPLLELAVTYEWANNPNAALQIYHHILSTHPANNPALLGLARIYGQLYQRRNAYHLYRQLLIKDQNNIGALTGLAYLQLADYRTTYAKENFEKVLQLQPNNADAIKGLKLLPSATKYLLTINTGQYTVGGLSSNFVNGNLFVNLNSTDQFLLQLTHNSSELPLGLVLDPTLLPKNTALVGFQRQIPSQYGYGFNYEYRERNKFPVENRVGFNANVFMIPNVQWLIGGRAGFPSPWNNQLLFFGPTIFTSLPVNFTLTGFWGHQQTGGGTSAYAFDLSKELPGNLFYNLGASYSPSQKSWDIHARGIYPITKTQALEAIYEHNYFNGLSFYNLGWRVYF